MLPAYNFSQSAKRLYGLGSEENKNSHWCIYFRLVYFIEFTGGKMYQCGLDGSNMTVLRAGSYTYSMGFDLDYTGEEIVFMSRQWRTGI